MERKHKIAVIGLGYVGLPLAVEFAKKYPVIGFDTNSTRINELMSGIDRTAEIENDDLKQLLTTTPGSKGLFCSDKPAEIAACNYFIPISPNCIKHLK
jgi:UDP-N-acetyl-D-galactosamine dehydrogenase